MNRLLPVTEEEKETFYKMNTVDYYQYIKQLPSFLQIQEKLQKHQHLDEEEWDYILKKLFLISCHALTEESQIGIAEEILVVLAKIGMRISEEYSSLYYDCYKYVEFITSCHQEKKVNNDLLDGVQMIFNSRNEKDLDCLLSQYHEACLFYEGKNAYLEAYKNTVPGNLSVDERYYIHAFHRAYEEEKKLVKSYEKGNFK